MFRPPPLPLCTLAREHPKNTGVQGNTLHGGIPAAGDKESGDFWGGGGEGRDTDRLSVPPGESGQFCATWESLHKLLGCPPCIASKQHPTARGGTAPSPQPTWESRRQPRPPPAPLLTHFCLQQPRRSRGAGGCC